MLSNKDLKNLILPLFVEQLLVMLVGLMDTFIISYAGEAAVSGVSLVNSFNTIFIYLFTALASGGAVVISQYIGRKSAEDASKSASQLLTSSTLFSIIIAILILCFHESLMHLMFGKVEPDVMEACLIYVRISAMSYPALAVYNAGAAMYRSMGKTSVTMYISVIANIINVVGNIIGVFVLHAGVAGVAYPSLISRVFSAAAITVLCFQSKNDVQYKWKYILTWNKQLLHRILRIAIPNGIENGIFQFVKVVLSSVVALFGTSQIAANGISQSIWSVAALVGVTMGSVYITVIGQCMGSGDLDMTERAFKKLTKITMLISIGWNILVFAATPLVIQFFDVSEETKHLVIILVLIHNSLNSVFFPISGPLGIGLRATGDVKYTMIVSIISTVGIRLVFSILFAITFNLGAIGIALAMCLDWIIRAAIFYARFKSGKWKSFRVI